MSNLPRMSMNSGAVSIGEDPCSSGPGAHRGARLSSGNVSTVESEPRVQTRYCRLRQVEKMASRDITKMKPRAAGFDDGMMFSVGLGSEVDSHSWAERGAGRARAGAQGGGVQLNSRTALMPSAPAMGVGKGRWPPSRQRRQLGRSSQRQGLTQDTSQRRKEVHR